MKKLSILMVLVGILMFTAPSAFSACGCTNAVDETATKTPFYYYLNPLQYVGIGNNYSSFTLNPVKGFKNCDRAKVKKCDACAKVKIKTCPTCQKAFATPKHNWIYIQPITPKCTYCIH